MKNVNKYEVVIYWDVDDRIFVAEVPNLPGCMAHGKTRRAALASIEVAIDAWIEVTRKAGESVPSPSDSLLTVGQAADRMGISAPLVRRYCANGRIPAIKIGRDWAIRWRDITSLKLPQHRRSKASFHAQSSVS
jgi:excisionase family DNA binding protein